MTDDWRIRFSQQNAYEAEGAAAGLAGKTRADCPYDQNTQSEAWNFWVYGCDSAVGEKQTLESGSITFGTTAVNGPTWTSPVEQAIRNKMWKPKWVSLPASSPGITWKSS